MPQPPQLSLRLSAEPFDPLQALAGWQGELVGSGLSAELPAAEAHVIGRVRGSTAMGEALQALDLEHYPGMTETRLQELARECFQRHGVRAVLVVHRVGRLLPGEAIVLVAVAADRRGPAQRCSQELLEALKHEAPFWKREWSDGQGLWVRGNTPLHPGAREGLGG
jgi:molybdopterin synthase catalytic subunit